ncbi:hypothetical protein EON64_08390 [archaeon]|nr:MAG: hypothetical protein EON64_08390 [archaeon]
MPKEEAQEPNCSVVERISQFYDDKWTAPAVEGEDEEYLDNVFKAPYRNNPAHFEFSEELGINLDPRLNIPSTPATTSTPKPPRPPVQDTPPSRTLPKMKSTKSFLNVFQPQVKLLHPKRPLINPRFMLSALKGVTHRFVLVLECEHRRDAPKDIFSNAPPRFSVGGLRASKDPRTVPLDQLIRISNKSPEVQLPAGR